MARTRRLIGLVAGSFILTLVARADVKGPPVCPITPACPSGGSCVSGGFAGVLDSICNLAFNGVCAERCGCCTTEDTELFAGVTFNPPTSTPADWPGLGGRGQLAAEAALCLLRDLGETNGGNGVFNHSEVSVGPFGQAKVEQRVALVDFDPVAKTMHGFHSASICAPPFGCVDNQVQNFTASLVQSPSPSFTCGDYPFDDSYGLNLVAPDTEHRLHFELTAITIFTPYGTISAHPEVVYQTALKTSFPTTVNDIHVPQSPCPDLETSIAPVVGRVDGAGGTALLCAAMPTLITDPGQGYGLVSQLGLGSRGVSTDEPLHGDSPRPDLDLRLPRTEEERKPLGSVSASVDFVYDIIGLLPDQFQGSPFEPEANVFVKPHLDAGFASQFQVHFSELRYRSIAEGPDCDVDIIDDARVELQTRSRVQVSFDIDAGMNLVLKLHGVSTPFGDITVTILDKHPKFELLPEPIADDDSDTWLHDGEAVFVSNEISPVSALSHLTTFSSGAVADPVAFRNECFQTPPPTGQTVPTGSFTPDDPNKFTTVLEFPCNICIAGGALSQGCGPDRQAGFGENYECRIDENGVCYDPLGNGGCKYQPIAPSDLPPGVTNTTGVLFATPQDPDLVWFCDTVQKTGCMDLCSYDPSADQPLQVVRSAADLEPDRCGGGPTSNGLPCATDANCDDHNPCTADRCVFEGEFGLCRYSPQDGACDDGLGCNGTDRCALGACAVHSGNPCAAAGECCEETTDSCLTDCPDVLPRCGNGFVQSGEECDDGNAAGGDGCSADCRLECGNGTLDPGETCDDGNTDDGDGCSASCQLERDPPDCSTAAPSLGELWPPNHQFVDITVNGVTDAEGDPVTITITSIAQDEPLDGPGDGNTCPDGEGVGTDVAKLRVERAGPPWLPADGRVYHVGFTATDDQGLSCNGTVTVCVPHDQGLHHSCGDQGGQVNSTGPCVGTHVTGKPETPRRVRRNAPQELTRR